MKSLHEAACRDALLGRVDRLRPEAHPAWGRMSVGQMLCHTGAALRMGLGELPVQSKGKRLFQFFPLKQLIIYVLPWPQGAPTAPELLAIQPAEFEADRARLKDLVGRFGEAPLAGRWPDHPVFGPLSGRDWSVLQRRHLEHHLAQFRV